MSQSVSNFNEQLKALFQNLGTGKIVTLFILVVGTAMGFVFLLTWSGNQDFLHLYSNLTPEDAGTIITKLKEQKIPYRLSSNGSSILIPGERIYETRLELASQGLPQGSGVGFEIFDDTKLGMTEFVQNVNYQRALQGELSRTINGLDEVESSRIHIVMPTKSLFIEDEEPSRASVILKLRTGRWLTKNQVQGIVHLVSSSISRLDPANVTIIDNAGKLLAGFKDKSTMGQISSEHLEYQNKLERNLENRVKTMLETALGRDKAIVRVACTLDFMRQEKTEEMYYPDNKVIRSEQLFSEASNEPDMTPKGTPGLAANISGAAADKKNSGNNITFQKQDKTMNYEIGKVTSHKIMPMGNIIRMSVAVIVDGAYKIVKSKGKKGKEEKQYIARSPEEMEKFKNIVKRAVNLNEERGDELEVANIPFETGGLIEAGMEIEEQGWMEGLKKFSYFLKYIPPVIFLLLAFLFVIKPVVRWLTSSSFQDMELLRQLPKTINEIEMEYAHKASGAGGLPFRDQASQLIASNTEGSAKLMKNWLKDQ